MSPSPSLLLHLLLFGSGLAGLGYEMVWTRLLTVSLGHEIVSVLAVVSAFFAGFALGSWLLDGPIRRSARPSLWYAGLEASIGVWSLALLALIPALGPGMATLIGLAPTPVWHWTVSFAFPLILLLPATAAMGATLPAAERLIALNFRNSHAVGGLYAANTFGAVAGVGITTFLLIPAWGYTATGVLLAAGNFGCAVGALLLVGSQPPAPAREAWQPICSDEFSRPRLAVTLFATGLLGIGYEVLVVRVSSQILGSCKFSSDK